MGILDIFKSKEEPVEETQTPETPEVNMEKDSQESEQVAPESGEVTPEEEKKEEAPGGAMQ